MPLQRLRRILDAQLRVTIDSSAETVQRVQDKIQKRAVDCTLKNKQPPATKSPEVVPALAATPSVLVRPIDLLRKIGDLTTPSQINMASLSASWATRRYFWAIADPEGLDPRFRLSQDAREMDFHQKTLLSDEFGIGFAGLMLERLFGTSRAVDVSEALADPQAYQNIERTASVQPDYLMWGDVPDSPYYVVECKGCQTQYQATMDQIRRGMEQVPSLVFGSGNRPVATLVVATLLQVSETTVYIIDPPEDPPSDDEPRRSEYFSEQVGKNTWRIHRAEEFARNARITRQLKLLNWAGQFASAEKLVIRERGLQSSRRLELPDIEPSLKRIHGMDFHGRQVPLFPEIGATHPYVFTGVRKDVLAAARQGVEKMMRSPNAEASSVDEPFAAHNDPNISLGPDGTCFVIEGL